MGKFLKIGLLLFYHLVSLALNIDAIKMEIDKVNRNE